MMMMSHLEFHKLEVESSENIDDVFEDLKQVGKDHRDAAGKPCGVCQKQFGNCGGFKHNVVFQLLNLVETARNYSEIGEALIITIGGFNW